MQLLIYAPAKINLVLDIIGKMPNRYHNVRMIMQTIDLYDVLKINLKYNGKLVIGCNKSDIPLDESNLAYKAAMNFFKMTGINNPGFEIYIHKNIPICAGLAGGSADAAAVIVALNKILNTNLYDEELLKIGETVGSDVPFCIRGGTMQAVGIGTELIPARSMPNCYIIIVKPNLDISTKNAYKLVSRVKLFDSGKTDKALMALEHNSIEELAKTLYNKFEDILNLDEVANIKKVMNKYKALGCCMSGSGPTIYALFREKIDAVLSINELKHSYKQVFLCQPVNFGSKILKIE